MNATHTLLTWSSSFAGRRPSTRLRTAAAALTCVTKSGHSSRCSDKNAAACSGRISMCAASPPSGTSRNSTRPRRAAVSSRHRTLRPMRGRKARCWRSAAWYAITKNDTFGNCNPSETMAAEAVCWRKNSSASVVTPVRKVQRAGNRSACASDGFRRKPTDTLPAGGRCKWAACAAVVIGSSVLRRNRPASARMPASDFDYEIRRPV
jgi:hypothetical protein